MAAVTICSDFGAPQNKICHCFPTYLPWRWIDWSSLPCAHLFSAPTPLAKDLNGSSHLSIFNAQHLDAQRELESQWVNFQFYFQSLRFQISISIWLPSAASKPETWASDLLQANPIKEEISRKSDFSLLTFLCPWRGAPNTKANLRELTNEVPKEKCVGGRAETWVLSPHLQPESCVTLGKSLNFSVSPLQNGEALQYYRLRAGRLWHQMAWFWILFQRLTCSNCLDFWPWLSYTNFLGLSILNSKMSNSVYFKELLSNFIYIVYTIVNIGFPGGASGKTSKQTNQPTCQCRREKRQVRFLGWEIPGGGLGNTLQYCCLENPIDRGASRATVHR